MTRVFWRVFGSLAQALFVVTVCRLFPFLRGCLHFEGLFSPAAGDSPGWWVVDGLLAVQFAVIHSVLLLPTVRKALGRWVPQPLYGCVFCVATCVCLLLAMEFWEPSGGAVWRLDCRLGGRGVPGELGGPDLQFVVDRPGVSDGADNVVGVGAKAGDSPAWV